MACGETEYIWQSDEWPRFRWNAAPLLTTLGAARHRQGRLLGQMLGLGFDLQLEAELRATIDEIVKTSEIEGERLDLALVRSSVARRLGVGDGALAPADRRVDAFVEMTLDAMRSHEAPLSFERLFGWHAAVFPTGHSGPQAITVGAWRTDRHRPMQVVSGPIGRRRVHYEAPPAARIPAEMERFLAWFEATRPGAPIDGLLRSGLAHLWFITIHPFDDGNGRIARAIADLALAQMEGIGQRFYSVSAQIQRDRARYYEMLERTQKGSLDVTGWLAWFVECFDRAVASAEHSSGAVLAKSEFWRRVGTEALSQRQREVLNRFLDGLDAKVTARRWAALGRCSVDTAQRDINELLERGLLLRNPGGSRRTSYRLYL